MVLAYSSSNWSLLDIIASIKSAQYLRDLLKSGGNKAISPLNFCVL